MIFFFLMNINIWALNWKLFFIFWWNVTTLDLYCDRDC